MLFVVSALGSGKLTVLDEAGNIVVPKGMKQGTANVSEIVLGSTLETFRFSLHTGTYYIGVSSDTAVSMSVNSLLTQRYHDSFSTANPDFITPEIDLEYWSLSTNYDTERNFFKAMQKIKPSGNEPNATEFEISYGDSIITKSSTNYSIPTAEECVPIYFPIRLKKVNITQETRIGYGAFMDADMLEEINFTNNTVEYINDYAFYDMNKRTWVWTEHSEEAGEEEIRHTVTLNGLSRMNAKTTAKDEIILDSAVQHIGYMAFMNNDSMVNLTISATEKEILPWAFACSDGLKSITIENNLLGEHQFENCDGLEQVTIPASLTEIRTHAFADCDSLTDITIESSLIGDYMFARCSALRSVTIPASVVNKEVGIYSFASCHVLDSVTIETDFIHDYMFFDCVGLREIDTTNNKTNNLKTIGYAAFGSCDALEKITVPFVGNHDFKAGDTPSKETLFGYIFGETEDKKSSFEHPFYKLDASPYGMGTTESLASVDDLSIAVVQRYAGRPILGDLATEEDNISSELGLDDYTYTFYVPASLRTVVIVNEDIIGFGGMMDLRQIENVDFEQVETIQNYGFYNCISLK